METNLLAEEQLQEIVPEEEKSIFFNSEEGGDDDIDVVIPDQKSLSDRDINVLSSYLKEMRDNSLISAQEELALGKDLMDEEEKRYELTERWIVRFTKMIRGRKTDAGAMKKQNGQHKESFAVNRNLQAFFKVAALHSEQKKLERLIKRSAAGSYERKKLCRQKVGK